MPVRTAERDVLQQMNAALNQTIASQSSPERFGAVMFSARFITQHTLEDITTTGGISKYEKVSKIVSAVMDYIVVSGSPQKFDEFVLLLRNEFQFDHLSQQLQECIDVCRSERSPPSAPARDTPTLASEHLVGMTAPPEATDGAAVPTSSPNRADSVPGHASSGPPLLSSVSPLVQCLPPLGPASSGPPLTSTSVDSDPLSIDDMRDVLEAVEALSSKWRLFSSKLGLKESALDSIEQDNSGDVKTCLYRALGEWLKLNYDHQRHGRPSWRRLAEAVRSLDYGLFETIAKRHAS